MLDPGPGDLTVIIFFLGIALIISLIFYYFGGKKLGWTFFLLSLLSNGVFYFMSSSLWFVENGFVWLIDFTVNIWPILNIFFLIYLVVYYKFWRKP